MLDIMHNSTTFFHTCLAYRCHRLLLFYTTFIKLGLDWALEGQCKAKPTGLIFLYMF